MELHLTGGELGNSACFLQMRSFGIDFAFSRDTATTVESRKIAHAAEAPLFLESMSGLEAEALCDALFGKDQHFVNEHSHSN